MVKLTLSLIRVVACFALLVSVAVLVASCGKGSETDKGESESVGNFILSMADLPDYERDIDHKTLLEGLTNRQDEALRVGDYIYNNNCFNCHGDADQEGSIPTAFKFWNEAFKVGKDPYSMYQTLTRGYGSMPPQTHLTPLEKYDIIYYIRERFLKEDNPDQYTEINDAYLATLPEGTNTGPLPGAFHPWADMDYGNFLINTYELAGQDAPVRPRSGGTPAPLPDEDFSYANFAYKGIAVRLDEGTGGVAAGKAWMAFDHDLMRVAGAWTGEGFIDWEGILFNGKHNISPRTIGDLHVESKTLPGWAHPQSGSFDDPRFTARDGRKFGPLPREWTQYKGLYQYGDKVVVSYTVGTAKVLETFGLRHLGDELVFVRELELTGVESPLMMMVAKAGTAVAVVGGGTALTTNEEMVALEIQPASNRRITVLMGKPGLGGLDELAKNWGQQQSLQAYTKGSSGRYPQKLTTKAIVGEQDGPFQVDILNPPFDSPWKNQFRLSGIDFFSDPNKGVICSTDGDVWLVEGFTKTPSTLTWQRIASGLFQPLGVKVIKGEIFVTCRDQIVRLHDFNGDMETDFYESFNSDHQVTDHFHEFAMGLQTDDEGNLYYAKSARHAREALVPQHGTLLKVSSDGKKTETIATGFRAANGVCLNPDGTFIVTDQEGHWNPMNRINWVKKGGFYGNMFGYNTPPDSSNTGMVQPLVWVERDIDRSPAELLWVDSKKWGALNGKLLNLSYGYGKIFVVPHEKVGGQYQGGVFELPIKRFATGIMRGRFNPGDGQLYACGLSAWGSSQPQLGGLYRIRVTDQPMHIPVDIKAERSGVVLTFSEKLDPASVQQVANYTVKTWDLLRSRKYGSGHHNVKELSVSKAELMEDGKTLKLYLPEIQPTWVMEIDFTLLNDRGSEVKGLIQNTIHTLGEV
ncbi:MAG: c-type cytochrome [Lunatimonas sp.]|nr:c-type cytochrome [Lunatimonas sp.]